MPRPYRLVTLVLLAGLACGLVRAEPPQLPADLLEFRSVDTAVTTRVSASVRAGAQPAYLGVVVVRIVTTQARRLWMP